MKHERVMIAVALMIVSAVSAGAQQTDFEAGIRAAQAQVHEGFVRESGLITDDCGRIKRNMNTQDLGQQYMECVIERLQRSLIAWNTGNRGFLETTREEVRAMFLAQAPAGSSGKEERAKFGNAAGYLHNRLANWHQQMATTVERMFTGQFLVETAARELVAKVQANLSTVTQRARSFVAAMQADGPMDADTVKQLINAFIDESFASSIALVEECHAKFNTDFNRIQRQIPTDFNLRAERFREVVDLYESIALKTIDAFAQQSLALWVKIEG